MRAVGPSNIHTAPRQVDDQIRDLGCLGAEVTMMARRCGSRRLDAVALEHQFDTVVGPTDFDDKGDLAVQNLVWYVWRDGTYVPLE